MPSNTQKTWFSRDADALRADLVRFAKANYGDKILDWSPSSLGGLLLELAAQVGDSFQYYLDAQFSESFSSTANEVENIQRFLQEVGIIPSGASPASGLIDIVVTVPADPTRDGTQPLLSLLPVISAGTTARSADGVNFILVDDVDFSLLDRNGDVRADILQANLGNSGLIESFTLRKQGIFVSGEQSTESFAIGPPQPFRTVSLSRPDIHEIVSVVDSDGRRWFEVDNLSQDTVYRRVRNIGADSVFVPTLLKTTRTRQRFVREFSLQTGVTTLRFGGGTSTNTPDAEDFGVPFRLSRPLPLQLDPNKIGRGTSFGESVGNTTLSVTYRHGGGSRHNAPPDSIRRFNNLVIDFPKNKSGLAIDNVLNTLEIRNPERMTGGAAALTPQDYQNLIPVVRAAQSRVVTQPDLVARAISMPSEFGRVSKATSKPSAPNQPTRLWVASKDKGRLVPPSGALMQNLKTYIANERLIGDAVDILPCPIQNWGLKVRVLAETGFSKQALRVDIARTLKGIVEDLDMNPDEPLDVARMRSVVLEIDGVAEIERFEVFPRVGVEGDLTYSNFVWDAPDIQNRIAPETAGIFEMLNPSRDILVNVG